ncbi:mechanosensitive ion channel family protein [Cyclobacterium marinum]|uniref:MscS Mechanosensitive ion channel n=1 Tax=Cyclobacterium marinum (strain ATCC 25205 / DSM 745 / LMG 13164 / NCIMB 1802) TaxID=880070 RepID=G0J2P3_CYCMS|nr:mechanosensitive ion channel family protein [Cyclobacterium marinum]AEL26626.1 MscS Mechanosensitive ion channel [Cyclobacterium marinum DSM 745]
MKEAFEKLRGILLGDLESVEQLAVSILVAILILIFFIYLSRWIKKIVSNRLSKKTDDHLLTNFISTSIKSLVMLFGFALLLRFLGLTGVVNSLLAGAGITAFIIGFALKDIGENFLAGILLAFKRPFKIGDMVEINGISGKVRALNLRDTQVKTIDGKDVFIPNASIIKNPMINFTIDGYLSYSFIVGLDYGSDYEAALKLITELIESVPGVLSGERKPTVYVKELASSTLNVKVTYWVNTYNRDQIDAKIHSRAIIKVLTGLEENGFTLPGDIVEVKNRQ